MFPSSYIRAFYLNCFFFLWLQSVWFGSKYQKQGQRDLESIVSPKVFTNNTREFKGKQVAEQTSHIPGSPTQVFTFRQQQCWDLGNWRALSIWTFLKGYTVSHLPSLQTNRKWDGETSRSARHKASQTGVFPRYLLISCTTAFTFVSLPSLFTAFFFPLMLPVHTLTDTPSRTAPSPTSFPFFLSPGFHSNDTASWAIRMQPRHGNIVRFELVLFKYEKNPLAYCKQFILQCWYGWEWDAIHTHTHARTPAHANAHTPQHTCSTKLSKQRTFE